jgi:hypothetical protein
MTAREQQRGDAFDEGAAAHLRGEERLDHPYESSDDADLVVAWQAGWDASFFFGLKRDEAVRT